MKYKKNEIYKYKDNIYINYKWEFRVFSYG